MLFLSVPLVRLRSFEIGFVLIDFVHLLSSCGTTCVKKYRISGFMISRIPADYILSSSG